MALSRRMGRREDPPIWSGFVDALTTLLLVLMFVLTIFTVVQSVLRETIDTQGSELDALAAQVEGLADALGLARQRAEGLEAEIGRLSGALDRATAEGEAQTALIATLRGTLADREADLSAAQTAITSFEAQVASLLSERDAARGEAGRLTASLAEVEAARAQLISEQEALNLALAAARTEIDAQAEEARLAAARREALDAMVADLRAQVTTGEATLADALARLQAAEGQAGVLSAQVNTLTANLSAAEKARLAEVAAAEALRARLADAEGALSEAERTRLADLAAAEALRERLKAADDELTAMTLSLEAERKRAEETLTLLAAAEGRANEAQGDAQVRAGLLEAARKVLSEKDKALIDSARKTALLNQQVIELRAQLGALQSLLDAAQARDVAAQVQVETLGSQLNAALAQVASEERRRAELEEAERKRLEAENTDLERFRSEFFGQLSALLQGREGVRVVGDRFVFSSEVLFTAGSADLAPEGRAQIAGVVATLNEIASQIPPQIDWIIRVDGHTDDVPLSGTGAFRDNWELSQARALSVVRFMQDDLGFDPRRMAATGFGEWRPVALGDSDYARAQNRRIELKLTER